MCECPFSIPVMLTMRNTINQVSTVLDHRHSMAQLYSNVSSSHTVIFRYSSLSMHIVYLQNIS